MTDVIIKELKLHYHIDDGLNVLICFDGKDVKVKPLNMEAVKKALKSLKLLKGLA